jgi:inner membrane protease ATP23
MVLSILIFDNVMKFMLYHLKRLSCPMTGKHFICQPCDQALGGHFDNEKGIILCENHLRTEEQTKETMVHETVHAFDECRVKIDWTDCRHHACSEIRAANLSGDCKFANELSRGNFGGFFKQHEICIKRRALLSISLNPSCNGNGEKIIDEVFESCLKDTEPFDVAN